MGYDQPHMSPFHSPPNTFPPVLPPPPPPDPDDFTGQARRRRWRRKTSDRSLWKLPSSGYRA